MVAELAGTHRERLRRFLLRRVRNAADVPDIVQEVFLRMLRIPNHEAVRSPEAYLFTVAQHVAQQHALREAAMPASIEIGGMLTQLHAAADADPVMQASAAQFVEEIESSLDKMSPKVRAVFLLHRRQGLSLEEISAHLHISFPMAKKYLVKALLQLRGHMERRQ
jgi:RNA polymerase sigma factor (sigma-70 family)